MMAGRGTRECNEPSGPTSTPVRSKAIIYAVMLWRRDRFGRRTTKNQQRDTPNRPHSLFEFPVILTQPANQHIDIVFAQ